MIYFGVPLQYAFSLAHAAGHLLLDFGNAILVVIKIFAGVEASFFLLLAAVFAISRLGRSGLKPKPPSLLAETRSRAA